MKTNHTTRLLVVRLVLVGSAVSQENKIKRSELPPAVEKTFEERSKGATIRDFSEEKENGPTAYEGEMLVKSTKSRDQFLTYCTLSGTAHLAHLARGFCAARL